VCRRRGTIVCLGESRFGILPRSCIGQDDNTFNSRGSRRRCHGLQKSLMGLPALRRILGRGAYMAFQLRLSPWRSAALIAALRRTPNTWSWPRADARFALVSSLSELRTNADAAVPEFLRHLSLTDQRDQFCCSLVAALCRVSAQPRTILPALATCLQSTNADLRRCTVIALSSMGPGARFALESLTNALQFQDTRRSVSEAIWRITSQGTTTASPP
jgi:hypothetical protein